MQKPVQDRIAKAIALADAIEVVAREPESINYGSNPSAVESTIANLAIVVHHLLVQIEKELAITFDTGRDDQ